MAKSSERWANWLSTSHMNHLIFPLLLYLPPLLLVHKSLLSWLPFLSYLSLPLPSLVSYSRCLLPKVRCSSRGSPLYRFSSVPLLHGPSSFPCVSLSLIQADATYPLILRPAPHGVIRSKLITHWDAVRAGWPRSGSIDCRKCGIKNLPCWLDMPFRLMSPRHFGEPQHRCKQTHNSCCIKNTWESCNRLEVEVFWEHISASQKIRILQGKYSNLITFY